MERSGDRIRPQKTQSFLSEPTLTGCPDWLENSEASQHGRNPLKRWAERDGISCVRLFVGLETAAGARARDRKRTAGVPRKSLSVGLVGHAGATLGAGVGWEERVQQGAESDIALGWKSYG